MSEVDALIEQLMREHSDLLWILFGAILLAGSIKNWNWLCDPVGKPHFPLVARGILRFIFFWCGLILIFCGSYFAVGRFLGW